MRRETRSRWRLPRRGGLARGVGAFTAAIGSAAREGRTTMGRGSGETATPTPARGRLLARPRQPGDGIEPGLHTLGLDPTRDAMLYVPSGYRSDSPAPLVLTLHGAGGDAAGGFFPLRDLADEGGLVLLSPASRGRTWDVLIGGYGPDVAFIDRALAATFARCAIDPARLAIAGFSDGASYALSLGIANGDLFGAVLAFSPGFAAPPATRGAPRLFVSHGTDDRVLPIGPTSRRLVPRMEDAGYAVRYQEFGGGHTVPPAVARNALAWLRSGADATPPAGTPAASPIAESTPDTSGGSSEPFTLYTFGDSILDCRAYNEARLDPGQLLVRNDDRLFPEFRGRDLSTRGPAKLDHHAVNGSTVADLPRQARNLAPAGPAAAILTIGGNDLLRGLLTDDGPGVERFAAALAAFLRDLPIRPVLIGAVYDPTFGDDARNFTGVDPVLARTNHRRVNAALAEAAARYGALADLHAHFLSGDPSWYTNTIEPSLRGASEVRRTFLPLLPGG